MKRTSGGRTYLQQLAQPVPPGTTVLTARPISAAYASETAPQVPIIEDTFNMPGDTQATPAIDFAQRHPPVPQQHSTIEPMERRPQSDANQLPRTLTHSSTRASSQASAESGRKSAHPVQHVEAPSAFSSSPRVRSSETAHSERPIATNPEQPETQHIQALSNENSRGQRHTGQQVIAPVTRDFIQEAPASSKLTENTSPSRFASQEDTGKCKEIQQASDVVAPIHAQAAAKQKKEKPEVRSTEGPRVHIGTVEIRAVLPQPVVPQPVTMTQNVAQNNAVAQARGRSGVAEPLARGLDWSYGLVQG